jgi:hypothetical protein
MNSLFALTELFITRTDPPPFLHLLTCCIILALYLAVAYITVATEGFYTYSFLNPANGIGKRAGYIVGILAAAIVIFLIIWGLVWLRRWVTEKKLGMKGKFANLDDALRAANDDEEMGERVVEK